MGEVDPGAVMRRSMQDPLLGYKIREQLYPGEDDYFRRNPNVGGMAAEDGQIILNPYSPPEVNRDAVARNEALRLHMRDRNLQPQFPVTPEQMQWFRQNAPGYSLYPGAMRQTILGRAYSGDPGLQYTPQQYNALEKIVGPRPAPTGPFITNLSPQEEAQFRQWVKTLPIPFDDSRESDYDMRGFWKNLRNDPTAVGSEADGLHFDDRYKTPYHLTFSGFSNYAPKGAASPYWKDGRYYDSGGELMFDSRTTGGRIPDEIIPTLVELRNQRMESMGYFRNGED